MGSKFTIGSEVWVPTSRLTQAESNPRFGYPFALKCVEVRDVEDQSVIVDGRDGPVKIAFRLAHPDPFGLLLIKIGDFTTEQTLLDPLAKSVLQFLRLLVSDDCLRYISVRSEDEIREFMAVQGNAFSLCVIVAHGKNDGSGIILPGDKSLPVKHLETCFAPSISSVVSLACHTGKVAFGSVISAGDSSRDFVGPLSSIHAVSASLFAQSLMNRHLLEGREFSAAVRAARDSNDDSRFIHWRGGIREPVSKPGRKGQSH